MKRKKLTKAVRNKYIFCYVMLIVAIYCVVTYFIVNLQSIAMAFQVSENSGFSMNNWKLIFSELLDRESNIWMALRNTMKYFLLGLIKVPLAFVISYFLYKKIWGYKFFRTVFFMPSMVAPVIFVLIFKDIIKVGGPLYILLYRIFGYEMPNLLSNFDTATNTILFYTLWSGFGANLLIFVGAMNRIDNEILDAARIDGCGSFREFKNIIVPMCWETLTTMIMLCTINIFMSSGPILYFTGGDYGTNTLSYWIFDQVRDGTYYYPSAVGLFFTLIAIPIVLFLNWLMKKGGSGIEY